VIFDLFLFDAVGDLVIEAVARADDGDFGIGIEEVEDATCGYLGSPPPMIRTFLLRTCQAKMSEPPPWTSGYFSAPMVCQ